MRTYRTDPRPAGSAFPLLLHNLMQVPAFVVERETVSVLCTWCNTYRGVNQFRYRSNGKRQSSVCEVCRQDKSVSKANSIPVGLLKTLEHQCLAHGITYETYRQRVQRGWSPYAAMTTPRNKTGRPLKPERTTPCNAL